MIAIILRNSRIYWKYATCH